MTSKEASRLKRKCLHISFSSSSRDDVPFPSREMACLSIASIDLMLIFTRKSKVPRGEGRGENKVTLFSGLTVQPCIPKCLQLQAKMSFV